MPYREIYNDLSNNPPINTAPDQQGRGLLVTWPKQGCNSSYDGTVQTSPGIEMESGKVNVLNPSGVYGPTYADPATVCFDLQYPLESYPLFYDSSCAVEDATSYECHASVVALDIASGDKRNCLQYKPPSYFSGTRMREFMAAMYGSSNDLMSYSVTANPTSGAVIGTVVRLFTNDPNDPAWLTVDNGYNATYSIYEYHVGTVLEYYLLIITAGSVSARKMRFGQCGHAIKQQLGNSVLPAEVSTAQQARCLMFADYTGLCPPKTDSFVITHNYQPIAHGWHGNITGNQFKVVHVQEVASDYIPGTTGYWKSATSTLNLTINNKGAITASYSSTGVKSWKPRRQNDMFWVPESAEQATVYNLNTTLDPYSYDGAPISFDSVPFYVIWKGDAFKVYTYTVEDRTSYNQTPKDFSCTNDSAISIISGAYPYGCCGHQNDNSVYLGSISGNAGVVNVSTGISAVIGSSSRSDAAWSSSQTDGYDATWTQYSVGQLPCISQERVNKFTAALSGGGYADLHFIRGIYERELLVSPSTTNLGKMSILIPCLDCEAIYAMTIDEGSTNSGTMYNLPTRAPHPPYSVTGTIYDGTEGIADTWSNEPMPAPTTEGFRGEDITSNPETSNTIADAVFAFESDFTADRSDVFGYGDGPMKNGIIGLGLMDFDVSNPFADDIETAAGAGNSIYKIIDTAGNENAEILRDDYDSTQAAGVRFIGFS